MTKLWKRNFGQNISNYKKMEQLSDDLKCFYPTVRALLKARHEKEILHIFKEENMMGECYNHDNWCGGRDYYHLEIRVSPYEFDGIDKKHVSTTLLDIFKDVIDTESIVISDVIIIPDVAVSKDTEENVSYPNGLKIFVTYVDSPYVFDRTVKVAEYPCLSLLANRWDDYGVNASFGLSYYDEHGKRQFIGKLKIIGNVKKAENEHFWIYKSIEEGKCEIGNDMCSLGQDMDYYSNLKEVFGNQYINVLYALRDCSVFPLFAKDFENSIGLYKRCLIRSDEAERTKREAPYLLKDIDLNDKYSFDYFFTPNYADHPTLIHFDFHNEGRIPNRLYAIIGKNGVGKTQFITTLPMNIYKKAKDFFQPQVPIFSKVIAVSNCPFDHFEIPHQTVEFQYVYCGMSVLRNGYKTILADEDIKDKLHENLIEIKSCNRLGHLQNILSPLFSEEELDDIINCEQFEKEKDWLDAIDAKYEIFSSGQNTFLYLFSSVVANIRYDSLLLFDEPETHLHPNAITLLMTAINRLLERYQSYGIIVTHSPLIIKELFSRNVYIMKRMNNMPSVKRIGMESFGENLTNLTEEVFDNKDITPYYVTMLKGLIDNGLGYEEIVRLVQSEDIPVSLNLTILLRTLIENKNNEEN